MLYDYPKWKSSSEDEVLFLSKSKNKNFKQNKREAGKKEKTNDLFGFFA